MSNLRIHYTKPNLTSFKPNQNLKLCGYHMITLKSIWMITWGHKDDKLIKLTRAKNYYNINNMKNIQQRQKEGTTQFSLFIERVNFPSRSNKFSKVRLVQMSVFNLLIVFTKVRSCYITKINSWNQSLISK